MNADTHSSEPDSVATSPSEQTTESDLSESAFLTRESEFTKQAIARTLEDLKSSLRTSADLRLWTRRHPWAALGVAAAAGFSAATFVAKRRDAEPSSPNEGTRDENRGPDHRQDETPDRPFVNGASKPLAATILGSLFDLAKVALQSSIAASAAAAQQAQAPVQAPVGEQPVSESSAAS